LCDDEWFVAGLHRGFARIEGEPLMVWGRPISQENYGTPIGRILAHLNRQIPTSMPRSWPPSRDRLGGLLHECQQVA
jgi:hypothetical protein